MIDWTGRTLSKVRIQGLVARGGMAELYLGHHTTLDRPMAVKILHAHLSENATLLTRFMDEAKSVAGLRHPNIVRVFDYDVVDDRPYIVMEFIEGASLADYMRVQREAGRSIPPEQTSRIIRALASALEYAHGRGIVHRDVKPSNVMLRREVGEINVAAPLPPDVEPVLTDFGVARLANVTARTASGEIIGTPAYMSPEQVRGETIDSRSDIYALGVMVYEMLAGRAPFDPDTETAASILVKHMTAEPPPLPGASPELQAVMNRVLTKDPTVRYQKAGDLAAGLEAALQAPVPRDVTPPEIRDPVLTTPIPDVSQQVKAVRRRGGFRPIYAIGGVLGLLVLLGVMVGIALVGRSLLQGGAQRIGESGDSPGLEATQAVGLGLTQTPPDSSGGSDGAADAVNASGMAFFRDEVLALEIQGLTPPPEGFVYQVWLTGGGTEPLNLGSADVSEGQVSFEFANPSGEHLTNAFGACVISLEPVADDNPAISEDIVLEARIGTETLQRIRLLDDIKRGQALQEAVFSGLPFQVEQYTSHQGFALDAIAAGDRGGAALHSEHVINIIEGRDGPNYGSWDQNERIENPGDDVGLLPYLLILSDAAQAAAAAPDASPETQALAEEIVATVDELVPLAEAASRNAQRVASADTMAEIEELVPEITSIRQQISDSVNELVQKAQSLELAIGAEVVSVQP